MKNEVRRLGARGIGRVEQIPGFRYVPKEELEDGLTSRRKGTEKEGLEAFPVVQKMDCYYPSGTTQNGPLFVPLEGKPLLRARREVEQARVESPLEVVAGKVEPPIGPMA
jgi:hypothetical protein